MGRAVTTSRAVIVAGMIASLGFAGVCPCSAGGALGEQRPRHVSHTTHICPCILRKGHCCCGTACQCAHQAPQQENQPAVPNPSNERGQPLGLAVDTSTFSASAAILFHAQLHAELLISGNLSLVVQGTRLNC
jgi:hypothetical protein